jgi:S1-C subfamily serine protease
MKRGRSDPGRDVVRRPGTIALAAAILLGALAPTTGEARPPRPGASSGQAWIGFIVEDAIDGGVRIVAVVPEAPAERAGLRAGDVVLRAGRRSLLGADDLGDVLREAKPGAELTLELLRAGREMRTVVEVGARPSGAAIALSLVPPPPRPPAKVPAPPAPPRVGLRGYGLSLAELTPDLQRHFGAPQGTGLLVVDIEPGRRAASDGFRVGDVLVRVGERPVRELEDARRLFAGGGDRAVPAALLRDGQTKVVTVRAPSAAEEAGPIVPVRPAWAAGTAAERAAAERAVRREIERLRARIERLKRKLESLESDPER